MKLEINIDQYLFTIDIHAYEKVEGLGKWADSDWDCYGCEELDYTVESVIELDEDEIPYYLTQDQIEKLVKENGSVLEAEIIKMLENDSEY